MVAVGEQGCGVRLERCNLGLVEAKFYIRRRRDSSFFEVAALRYTHCPPHEYAPDRVFFGVSRDRDYQKQHFTTCTSRARAQGLMHLARAHGSRADAADAAHLLHLPRTL